MVEDIKRGFDLTGSLPRSGVFSHKFRPKVSDLGREALLGTVQSAGDSEIDRGLFEATVKEVEKGFIEGPVGERESASRVDLNEALPSQAEEQGQTN